LKVADCTVAILFTDAGSDEMPAAVHVQAMSMSMFKCIIITETKGMHVILFGMWNRTFDPYLAAMQRILLPAMHVRVHFLAGNAKCTIPHATMCKRSS
jgi:hypothetical protein